MNKLPIPVSRIIRSRCEMKTVRHNVFLAIGVAVVDFPLDAFFVFCASFHHLRKYHFRIVYTLLDISLTFVM